MSGASIIAVLIFGLLLMALEVLVIPGFGVAGILGLVAMAAGVGSAFAYLGPLWGSVATVGSLVGAGLLIFVAPRTKAGRRMILEQSQGDAIAPTEGGVSIGDLARAVTPLRPSGAARFGDVDRDVVTSGEYIEQGTLVRVIEIEGVRVVVEAFGQDDGETSV